MEFKLNISTRNSKLGNIPNLSLVPVKDCINCEGCKNDCYALKALIQYPNVRKAWMHNSEMFRTRLAECGTYLTKWVNKRKPEHFRIHVAGDFISQPHINTWVAVANKTQKTKYLAFTKSSNLDFSNIPANLIVLHSQWVEQDKINTTGINAWIEDDKRIPADTYLCPGSAKKGAIKCSDCLYCWNNPTKDVIFHKH